MMRILVTSKLVQIPLYRLVISFALTNKMVYCVVAPNIHTMNSFCHFFSFKLTKVKALIIFNAYQALLFSPHTLVLTIVCKQRQIHQEFHHSWMQVNCYNLNLSMPYEAYVRPTFLGGFCLFFLYQLLALSVIQTHWP